MERRRTLAFTIYLAVSGQEEHRERLLTLFWPERNPSQYAHLRRTLYQVHHLLGEGWLTTDGEGIALPPRPDFGLTWRNFANGWQSAATMVTPPMGFVPLVCRSCVRR